MRAGGGRRPLAAVIAGVLTFGLVACRGAGSSSSGGAAASVDGLPITHFQSGLKANAPTPQLKVENASDDEADRLATATTADVEDYWSEELPANFGIRFQPVTSLLSYESNGANQVNGWRGTEKNVNAFYCGKDDSVSWDRGVLLPTMIQQFGRCRWSPCWRTSSATRCGTG
jgi:predicted metalloprotease